MPACVFLALQVLHYFEQLTDEELIVHFSQCPLQALISQRKSGTPTLVHYVAMYGRSQVILNIFLKIIYLIEIVNDVAN